MDALAAIELNKKTNLKNITYYKVPQSTYLVFTFQGKMDAFKNAYEYIYGKWLALHPFQANLSYNLEFYNKNYKSNSKQSILYIYIPIKK